MQPFHGSVVDIAGAGVFLRGPSASGKSDLALRLMDRGAILVADDQVLITHKSAGLRAAAPDSLYGLLEVRGVGIISVPAIKGTIVRLVVDLVDSIAVQRLPENITTLLDGKEITCLQLNAFEVSTPIKIELALRNLNRIGGIEKQYR